MRLLAALSAAVFAYLGVGYLLGQAPPRLGPRARPPRPRRPSAQTWLNQAGARVTPAQFSASSMAGGLVAFTVVLAVTGAAAVAILPAVAVAALPRAYFAGVRRRLARQRVKAWPDALRHLVASLSTPLSLHQSLVALGESGPPALRPAFVRYSRLAAALDQRAALEAVRAELADSVSDRVIDVLVAAVDQGPSIVLDLLADQARATTADLELVEHIESAQLTHRLNARGVMVLPYFILMVLCAGVPEFRAFYRTPAGVVVLAVGVAMSIGGMTLINRLGRIPSEERVFGPTEAAP